MIIFDKLKELLFTEVETDDYVEEVEETKKEERRFVSKEKSVVYEKKVEHQDIQPKVVSQQKSATAVSIDIKADGPKVSKTERRLKPLERKEFEIPLVISPINGPSEEIGEEKIIKKVEYIKKPAAKKNSLGTVISPFYGTGELEEFEAKAKIELEQEQLDVVFVDDDIENISLDQMISPVVEEENEMIQFSLFGDSKPVKEFGEEPMLEEEETEEDLPF